MRTLISVLVTILFPFILTAQHANPLLTKDIEAQKKWVDSVYNTMSLTEKIGQLYMVQVKSNSNVAEKIRIKELIKDYKVGGIIFSTGGPVRQAKLNNQLQEVSKIPLLIGMDAEWGLSMRLDSTYAFPWNMTLGAIKNNKLIEQTGKQLGEHCKRIGVHFNFAPDVDINTNPLNPIIGNRSFGENRENVTAKALAFMKGMHSAGILSSAKHFPGHGDTATDSHYALPLIPFNEKRLDSIELYPYKTLIKEGVTSVMVGHLNVPSLEKRNNYPSSLSKPIITNLLINTMGFNGLVITDALEMKGVSNFKVSGEIDLEALKAGNDILLMSANIPAGIIKIKEAIDKGVITNERLELSVKKILQAKYKVGLNKFKPIETANLYKDLNRIQDASLSEELFENAITVVKNESDIIPIQNLDKKRIAYVALGDDSGFAFYNQLKKYANVHHIKGNNLNQITSKLKGYNTIVIGFHRSNATPWKDYTFSHEEIEWIEKISGDYNVILDLFVKPYALSEINTSCIEGIIVSYQNSEVSQCLSAELIFGALSSKGKLPVSINKDFKVGLGLETQYIKTLGYTIPERVGINSLKLLKIDSIAQSAIASKAAPGMQILAAKNGKVFYNKTFGYHTYDKVDKVAWDDIYDVASLTKILCTLPLVMELEEQKKITLNSTLGQLLPKYKNTNKANITILKMLSHYAQLKPWIPFYLKTLDSITKKPSPKYYSKTRSRDFDLEVVEDLYLRSDYEDSIQQIIKESELLKSLSYKYSDLPYYILKEFIENKYKTTLDQLAEKHFYKPLGANYTTYNPYYKVSNKHIVPSEIDSYFRYQKLQGFVHDMGAAMQNGIGGHAGVFSNANDIAKIMQMYLQNGYYGGHQYFKPETVKKFNTRYFKDKGNRRGVGFDKPQLSGVEGPVFQGISNASFGHSGFTGTFVWADPDTQIVYVFLSNRTFPTMANNELINQGIRTKVFEAIYQSII